MKKEKLNFEVYTDNLIKYFGEQNFENEYSAIYEIVKNSHDAGANNIEIIINSDSICINDDGIGMTYEDIKNNWMQIGKSEKEGVYDNGRPITGDKGIGRFALAKLGNNIVLKSRREGNDGVIWESDWKENILEKTELDFIGTSIEIKSLNDKWDKSSVEKLVAYLSKVKKDDNAKIIIKYEDEIHEVENIFNDLQRNTNYFIDFNFRIEENELIMR